jgi:hypothetical protein
MVLFWTVSYRSACVRIMLQPKTEAISLPPLASKRIVTSAGGGYSTLKKRGGLRERQGGGVMLQLFSRLISAIEGKPTDSAEPMMREFAQF